MLISRDLLICRSMCSSSCMLFVPKMGINICRASAQAVWVTQRLFSLCWCVGKSGSDWTSEDIHLARWRTAYQHRPPVKHQENMLASSLHSHGLNHPGPSSILTDTPLGANTTWLKPWNTSIEPAVNRHEFTQNSLWNVRMDGSLINPHEVSIQRTTVGVGWRERTIFPLPWFNLISSHWKGSSYLSVGTHTHTHIDVYEMTFHQLSNKKCI